MINNDDRFMEQEIAQAFKQLEQELTRILKRGTLSRRGSASQIKLSQVLLKNLLGNADSILKQFTQQTLLNFTSQKSDAGPGPFHTIFLPGQTGRDNTTSAVANPFTQLLNGAVEGIVGQLFYQERSKTTTVESQRSLDAQANWNLSRTQRDALLAQAMQRGQVKL